MVYLDNYILDGFIWSSSQESGRGGEGFVKQGKGGVNSILYPHKFVLEMADYSNNIMVITICSEFRLVLF